MAGASEDRSRVPQFRAAVAARRQAAVEAPVAGAPVAAEEAVAVAVPRRAVEAPAAGTVAGVAVAEVPVMAAAAEEPEPAT